MVSTYRWACLAIVLPLLKGESQGSGAEHQGGDKVCELHLDD